MGVYEEYCIPLFLWMKPGSIPGAPYFNTVPCTTTRNSYFCNCSQLAQNTGRYGTTRRVYGPEEKWNTLGQLLRFYTPELEGFSEEHVVGFSAMRENEEDNVYMAAIGSVVYKFTFTHMCTRNVKTLTHTR